MPSCRVGNEARRVKGGCTLLCIDEGFDSGSMVRSLMGSLSTAAIGIQSVVGVGPSPADGPKSGSQV